MRSAARRNETANHTLTVGITGAPAGAAPAGDAKIAGTPYHAKGLVPCSVGPNPKGSAQCSFGVIRGAPGNAEVYLAGVGYDVTLHKDKIDAVLIFRGTTVTNQDPGKKVTAAKHRDEWSIGVNDVLFYAIPEAVIVAGWLAGKIMGGGFGLVGNLIVGVIGAVVGGFLFGLLGLSATSLIGSIITATVGAVVLLFVVGMIRKKAP
jgi:uncharacterized membrane protein YeaQ/YmgE (transglycosylase-associated protein family)